MNMMYDFIAPTEEEREFLLSCLPGADETFFRRCAMYGAYLYKTNETLNLTRIPPESFWSKHVCDALSILRAIPDLEGGGDLCDLGCGAGIPSVILAAALPDLSVLAMDSTRKKILFVQETADLLSLKNLHTVHGRANELGRKDPYQEAFDYVTARAVSDALTLASEAAGLLVPEGRRLIYRTESQAEPETHLLRKKRIRYSLTEEFSLPADAGKRMFMILENLPKHR